MTLLVLAGIILACALVAIFGYLSKRQEILENLRARQLAKYKERVRTLDNMIFGLPPNYLPKTLKILIYASIIDSLKHLRHLSGSSQHDEQISRVKQTLNKLIKLDSSAEELVATEISYSELKECKYLLKDLHSLIMDFHNEGTLDRQSAANHLGIVKKIMLEVTLDTYNEAALQALNGNNKNLALHYFTTALSRIQQSSDHGLSEERENYFLRKVDQLQQELACEDAAIEGVEPELPDAGVLAEWQELENGQNAWRKKRY